MEYPAVEMGVRDWLRTESSLVALVGGDSRRIDIDYSGDKASTHLTLFRAGGGPSRKVPLDNAVLAFHCWGRGRGAALNLATELINVLNTRTEVALNDTAWLRGCTVESSNWLPDPTGQPRYVVIARVIASARQTVPV